MGAATSRNAPNRPVYGGTLKVAYTREFAPFDPSQAVDADRYSMNGTLFEGLYRYDRNGHPQLDLAASPPTISDVA
jgi:ABC-type oligopeptide transport system substrate-binding subunit